jgi:hypothetical protein
MGKLWGYGDSLGGCNQPFELRSGSFTNGWDRQIRARVADIAPKPVFKRLIKLDRHQLNKSRLISAPFRGLSYLVEGSVDNARSGPSPLPELRQTLPG